MAATNKRYGLTGPASTSILLVNWRRVGPFFHAGLYPAGHSRLDPQDPVRPNFSPILPALLRMFPPCGLLWIVGVVQMEKRSDNFYEFDSFRVDPSDRSLTREGQPIPLTPMAFNTLLFFIENRERLVTKAELLTAIWPDTSVDDPNLAVMISVVRKALGDSGHTQKYISTVAKSGYKFTADLRRVAPREPQIDAIPTPLPVVQYPSPHDLWMTPRAAAVLVFGLLAFSMVGAGLFLLNGGRNLQTRVPEVPSSTRPSENFSGSPIVAARASYLKGRYSWSRGTESGLKQSIVYFTNAINEDPHNALAYAGLADVYGSLATWSVQSSDVAYRKAREYAQRAVELDDSLSQAHSALGTIAMVYDWNFPLAEREFRRAVELGPDDPIAHQRLGGYLAATGSLNDALRQIRIAHDLDPLSLDIGATVGRFLYYARQYDDAIAEYRKLIDLDPHYSVAHYYLGVAYFVQQDYRHAIPELEESSRLVNNREPLALGLYAAARARNGDHAGAQAILADLCERSRREYVSPAGMAALYIGLGDSDEALEWVDKMFRDHIITAVYAGVDPFYDSMRSNPRFLTQLKRVHAISTSSLPQFLRVASR